MGRYLTRASVAVPAVRASGRRREGPDEDIFTLTVEAVEGLGTSDNGGDGISRIHLFGDFTEEQGRLIGVAVGHDVTEAVRHPDHAEPLRELLVEEGGNTGTGTILVIAAESWRDRPQPPAPLRDSGAIALRLAAAPQPPGAGGARAALGGFDPRLHGLELGGEGSALQLAAEWAAQIPTHLQLPHPQDASWEAGHPPPAPDLETLSEGAYVPKPRYLENLPSRWRFAADRCGRCGTVTFPVRGACRSCGASEGLSRFELPLQGGSVAAATTVHPGAQPTEFDWRVDLLGAYDVVLVELAPGARVTLQAADAPPGTIRPGDHVGTRLRRLYPMEGEWRYGRKAVPLRDAPGSPS